MSIEFSHIPVLLDECIEGLDIKPDGTYIDCTTGGGGHSFEIAKKLDFKKGRLICFDQDKEALTSAKDKLKDFSALFINANFKEIANELEERGITGADGILMDLGVSSYQLDNKDRGFSFHEDAPLDMRMSGEGLSAFDVVNLYETSELERVLFQYGEEKYARGIVKGIEKARGQAPIKTTGELAEIIRNNVPLRVRNEKNPCRKTFQAIRIEVNDELGALKSGIEAAFKLLRKDGRLLIISFHSLEDRIVKNMFRNFCTGCTCPSGFPICVCGKIPKAELVNRKPLTAGEREHENNNRSRSAKLRIIKKIVCDSK